MPLQIIEELTEAVKVGFELWRLFNGFPPSLRNHEPEKAKNKYESSEPISTEESKDK